MVRAGEGIAWCTPTCHSSPPGSRSFSRRSARWQSSSLLAAEFVKPNVDMGSEWPCRCKGGCGGGGGGGGGLLGRQWLVGGSTLSACPLMAPLHATLPGQVRCLGLFRSSSRRRGSMDRADTVHGSSHFGQKGHDVQGHSHRQSSMIQV